MSETTGFLVLADGTVFKGQSIGATGYKTGELVFNTSMTGYQEILSDPSYAQQIITFTAPHIGVVGTNQNDNESNHVWALGMVCRDYSSRYYSNWRAEQSLSDYLKRHEIIGLSEIDTRKLTRILSEHGAQNACIVAGDMLSEEQAIQKARDFAGLKGMDIAQDVSSKDTYAWEHDLLNLYDLKEKNSANSQYHVVVVDFGVKQNILRFLVNSGFRVTVVPARSTCKEIMALCPDGVLLSNGPGDPEPCDYAIAMIKDLANCEIPIFGICLGHQLLGLALGAKTMKMKFGHHGANHPVYSNANKRTFVSSQNHGFALEAASMPETLEVVYHSLFDGTVQGVRHKNLPIFGMQGHPEASPGPKDLIGLFDEFFDEVKKHSSKNKIKD